jgi:hypothetical protein
LNKMFNYYTNLILDSILKVAFTIAYIIINSLKNLLLFN